MDFFCANCKSYNSYVPSGYGNQVKRNSSRFKCAANHTDFSFPTDWLMDDYETPSCGSKSMDSSSNSNVSCHDSHSSMLDESYDVDVFLN
jgi:hypothetical protein